MLGGIIGDVVGSVYEHQEIKGRTLPLMPPAARITDDSILMGAIAAARLTDGNYERHLRQWGHKHRTVGFGPGFDNWLADEYLGPYGSNGNGAAVRAIPLGWLANSEEELLIDAFASADVTHDHPDSYRGARAIALAIFKLRRGDAPEKVFPAIAQQYDYDIDLDLEQLHLEHEFDASCEVTVPMALCIARTAQSFEDAMALGLYVGGDTDTILAMAGALFEARDPDSIPAALAAFAIDRARREAPELIRLLKQVRPDLTKTLLRAVAA